MTFAKAKFFVAAAVTISGNAQAQLHQAMLINNMNHVHQAQTRPAETVQEACQRIADDRRQLAQIELFERTERGLMAGNQMSLRQSQPSAALTRAVANSKRKSEALIAKLETSAKPLRIRTDSRVAKFCARHPYQVGRAVAPRQ